LGEARHDIVERAPLARVEQPLPAAESTVAFL
jgi:hypothetical protein